MKGVTMKVIFLDIDGVLNSQNSIIHYHEFFQRKYKDPMLFPCSTAEKFPKVYMKNLLRIVKETNAKIVVSSCWRISYPDGRLWTILLENFKQYNLDTEIIGVTSRLQKKRGDEIRKWLSENSEVESFVIIDDDSDMCEFTESNLARTHWMTGLTKSIADKAIEILNATIVKTVKLEHGLKIEVDEFGLNNIQLNKYIQDSFELNVVKFENEYYSVFFQGLCKCDTPDKDISGKCINCGMLIRDEKFRKSKKIKILNS
jgi:hypothetical protein